MNNEDDIIIVSEGKRKIYKTEKEEQITDHYWELQNLFIDTMDAITNELPYWEPGFEVDGLEDYMSIRKIVENADKQISFEEKKLDKILGIE